MEYSPAFIAKDRARRLLTRGLSHDYKRVLATLARRVDEIRKIADLDEDQGFVNQCDLLKTIIRKISRKLDEIGDAIDTEPTRPATSIVSEYRTPILNSMQELSTYSHHVQSRLDNRHLKRPSLGGPDLRAQCQRAEKQIKALMSLPFKEQDINLKPLNLRNEVNRIIEDLYDVFEKNGIDSKRQVTNNLHSTISTDQLLFTICLSNVLTNSIVHSGRREDLVITLDESSSIQGEGEDRRTFVDISTWDNGIGIPPEDSKIIFHLFKQGTRTSPSEGNGVGLPFARAAAHMLGGNLTLAEDFSTGAKFVLSLPRSPELRQQNNVRDLR